MKVPEVLYTYTYGFRDCDPIATVWGRTPKYALRALRSAIAYTARTYANESESERDIKDQLWVVGPYAHNIADIELEDSSLAEEFADDLTTSPTGYLY